MRSKWTILQKTHDAWHLLSLCAKWLVLAIKITIITIMLTEPTAQSQAFETQETYKCIDH